MNVDESRVDDAILALLALYSFDGGRAWKGFDEYGHALRVFCGAV